MDQLLDVVIDPDLSWRWKDEDELREAVELGLMSEGRADAVRREAERAIERLEARQCPAYPHPKRLIHDSDKVRRAAPARTNSTRPRGPIAVCSDTTRPLPRIAVVGIPGRRSGPITETGRLARPSY